MRYTAGCVLRKIENKYVRKQKKSDEARQCVAAVREMAGKLRTSQHHSCEFINSVDQGGLYHVHDSVYDVFVAIEMIVNEKLSALFTSKGEKHRRNEERQIGLGL